MDHTFRKLRPAADLGSIFLGAQKFIQNENNRTILVILKIIKCVMASASY